MVNALSHTQSNWISRLAGMPAAGLAKKIVLTLLSRIEHGHIELVDGEEHHIFGGGSAQNPKAVKVEIQNPEAYASIAYGGSIGAGEAYMQNHWETDDLTGLIRLVIRNQMVFDALDSGTAHLAAPLYKVYHYFRRNTLAGSRKNIVAHYDLGNDFYRLFLDETMTYSSGVFERPDSTLKEASIAKYDRICRKLGLSQNDHLLEIGTGWGGFAIHAVQNYGCRITTTTISDEQYALAQKRIKAAGIEERVTLLKTDYRELEGQFDKLVSIEMIEAVGHQYLGSFMSKCADLLKPSGVMSIQAITIADWAYDQHKKEVDFIKRYIFPGSCIPSVTAISNAVARETDLRPYHLEDITPHYARTLRRWYDNFMNNIEAVKSLGFNQTFIRMWEYYLRYCEAGFEERYLGSVQIVFTKPLARLDQP